MNKNQKLQLLFIDVDGTLTDGKLYIGNNEELFKAFNVKDGCGIHDILPNYNIIPIIITARISDIIKKRCEELEIKYLFQGCRNKKEKMMQVAAEFGITLNNNGFLERTAYIGDDILDIPCMEIAEYKGCPADAVSNVKEICDFVSLYNGGDGAVRDFVEWLIKLEEKNDNKQ